MRRTILRKPRTPDIVISDSLLQRQTGIPFVGIDKLLYAPVPPQYIIKYPPEQAQAQRRSQQPMPRYSGKSQLSLPSHERGNH